MMNPFVIGQWVKGKKFYGRAQQIAEVLTGPRFCRPEVGKDGSSPLETRIEAIDSISIPREHRSVEFRL